MCGHSAAGSFRDTNLGDKIGCWPAMMSREGPSLPLLWAEQVTAARLCALTALGAFTKLLAAAELLLWPRMQPGRCRVAREAIAPCCELPGRLTALECRLPLFRLARGRCVWPSHLFIHMLSVQAGRWRLLATLRPSPHCLPHHSQSTATYRAVLLHSATPSCRQQPCTPAAPSPDSWQQHRQHGAPVAGGAIQAGQGRQRPGPERH